MVRFVTRTQYDPVALAVIIAVVLGLLVGIVRGLWERSRDDD